MPVFSLCASDCSRVCSASAVSAVYVQDMARNWAFFVTCLVSMILFYTRPCLNLRSKKKKKLVIFFLLKAFGYRHRKLNSTACQGTELCTACFLGLCQTWVLSFAELCRNKNNEVPATTFGILSKLVKGSSLWEQCVFFLTPVQAFCFQHTMHSGAVQDTFNLNKDLRNRQSS